MLGRVFLDLGVRGGRIQKWSYEVVVNRGGGGNFIVFFWWRFAHPILTHHKIGSALWLGSEVIFISVF